MVLELLNNFLVRLPFNNPTLIIETPDSLSDVPNHVFQSLNAVAIRDLDAYSLRVDEEEIYLYFFCFVGVLSSFPSWISKKLPPFLKLPFIGDIEPIFKTKLILVRQIIKGIHFYLITESFSQFTFQNYTYKKTYQLPIICLESFDLFFVYSYWSLPNHQRVLMLSTSNSYFLLFYVPECFLMKDFNILASLSPNFGNLWP